MNVEVCRNPSDAVVLYLPQRLYLKPFAKLNISVQLPSIKVHGKAISNWEVMEKLRNYVQPESFSLLKVVKNSTEIIRFDAELENPSKLERVLRQLDDRVMQLTDFPEPLKVRACEAKSDFPSRHSWDAYFRDATDMDEMKPGERPDTVHITNLPVRWFIHPRDKDADATPSESIFKKVFDKFGVVRQVDVPISDPFRLQMKSSMRGITMPLQTQKDYFEGYIQFSEYVGFVRCIDALRGCKLLKKGDELAEWCSFGVTFDKTKHMTDAAIKRRSIVRERLIERQRARDDEEKLEKDKIARKEAKERMKQTKAERDKLEKMREREEKRKKKQLAKLVVKDNVDVNGKYAEEKQKLVRSQRRLQAIGVIEELFNRIELRGTTHNDGSSHGRYYSSVQSAERKALVTEMKINQEIEVDKQANLLQKAKEGRLVIRSVLETKKPKPRTSSISSISSEEFKDVIKTERHSPERDYDYKKTGGMNMFMPHGFGMGVPPPYAPVYYAPPHPSMYHVRSWAPRYTPRVRAPRGRGRGGRPRMPHYEGPDATTMYYQYFKKLHENESRNDHDDRCRSRSRRRSYSRSRSRSRRRSYSRSRHRSRSRSRSSRSRSRSRRTRSRSRRSRSRSRRSKSPSKSRRTKSRSKSRRSKSRSRSRSKSRRRSHSSTKLHADRTQRPRSKSWSLPKVGENGKSWSKSPKNK